MLPQPQPVSSTTMLTRADQTSPSYFVMNAAAAVIARVEKTLPYQKSVIFIRFTSQVKHV